MQQKVRTRPNRLVLALLILSITALVVTITAVATGYARVRASSGAAITTLEQLKDGKFDPNDVNIESSLITDAVRMDPTDKDEALSKEWRDSVFESWEVQKVEKSGDIRKILVDVQGINPKDFTLDALSEKLGDSLLQSAQESPQGSEGTFQERYDALYTVLVEQTQKDIEELLKTAERSTTQLELYIIDKTNTVSTIREIR